MKCRPIFCRKFRHKNLKNSFCFEFQLRIRLSPVKRRSRSPMGIAKSHICQSRADVGITRTGLFSVGGHEGLHLVKSVAGGGGIRSVGLGPEELFQFDDRLGVVLEAQQGVRS